MSENNSNMSDTDTNMSMSETLNTEDVDSEMGDEYCDILNMIEQTNNIKKEMEIVSNDKRISKNKMTKYEFVRLIGERKQQLTMGAKPLIKVNPKSEKLSYEEIAIEELKNNMIPIKIKRPVNNHYEVWSIEELDKSHIEHLFK
jgi:DNA-directed RNA polymerase subunit K/omega